ncbi:mannose-6-phosphate isomerase [Halyomorpha halys]|uniref:mannose-6-phosphate isomerase n=1 Tax=Halyomorpha halys TaxID=286706 RepID=UPI0006D52091|nr:mannose-6-phosphate isomerase-like [Halyomorpha halys]
MLELWGELALDDWGAIGTRSKAGIYYWHSKRRNLLKDDICYSAVIFSGNKSEEQTPTTIASKYLALWLFIRDTPQVLGIECAKDYNNHLPFQVRLLSLRRAMPLVSHPPKEHAVRLNRMDPERYLSDEHKPKLVIVNYSLETLAGLRNKEEIFSFLSAIPELSIVIPYSNIQDYLHCGKVVHLKRMLYFLMSATYQEMKLSLDIFFTRMRTADETERESALYSVLARLHDQYPYDCGIYAPLFFNNFTVEPGNAIFLPSGTVHTYLFGDCIEISTCSENIVRVGLTNLYKDVDEFLTISDFSSSTFESLTYRPTIIDEYVTSFTPPAKEFGVFKINVPADYDYTIKGQDSCSIILVTRGSAMLEDSRIIKLGTTLFVLPYQPITFKVRKEITIYKVYPNPDAPEGEYGNLF